MLTGLISGASLVLAFAIIGIGIALQVRWVSAVGIVLLFIAAGVIGYFQGLKRKKSNYASRK